jgi:hypothetical protein
LGSHHLLLHLLGLLHDLLHIFWHSRHERRVAGRP